MWLLFQWTTPTKVNLRNLANNAGVTHWKRAKNSREKLLIHLQPKSRILILGGKKHKNQFLTAELYPQRQNCFKTNLFWGHFFGATLETFPKFFSGIPNDRVRWVTQPAKNDPFLRPVPRMEDEWKQEKVFQMKIFYLTPPLSMYNILPYLWTRWCGRIAEWLMARSVANLINN